jgi:hypothetical protein
MPPCYMDLERLNFYIDYEAFKQCNNGIKRCRRMRGIKLSAIGECAECAVKFGAVGEGGQ